MTQRYLVVFEQAATSFGAMSPEIPGCYAVAQSLHDVRERFVEAAEAHLSWLAESGDSVPMPGLTTIDVPTDEPGDTSTYILKRVALTLPVLTHASAA